MTEPAVCVTCAICRPDVAPRIPNFPPVCDGDRQLIDRWLVEIGNLHSDLRQDEPPIVDQRVYERFGTTYREGRREPVSLGTAWADPNAALGGVAPINSRSKQPSVSGSRERPIPVNTTALDLQAPAKVPTLAPSSRGRTDTTRRGWPEDQIGYLSAATVLDQWARDIRDLLYPGHHLPPAGVDHLVTWIRNRLHHVCDRHPAIADLADELRALRGALRAATGATEPPTERCDGIPCRRCDLVTLYRMPGGDIECVNPDCRAVMRADEYGGWLKTLVAEVRIKRRAA